ncbi:MAG: isoaspartyl peptidase/L-asparaginase [Acidobacteria bacterium]|nr:isoaspartyl peptidase/L-asparaginase [Acidobacteriota bacterium]
MRFLYVSNSPVSRSVRWAAALLGILMVLPGWCLSAGGKPVFVIAVHGGAGAMGPESFKPGEIEACEAALRDALEAGHRILRQGGTSLDAVEAAVRVLEDSPLFNAGKGSVFNADGKIEMDASIMDGRTGAAGAVAAVRHVKNPVSLARKVMENSPHVLLAGDGAEVFAREQGVELAPEDYFFTEKRWKQLQDIKEKERKEKEKPSPDLPKEKGQGKGACENAGKGSLRGGAPDVHGTVGAVALDTHGNLAAATSTGGRVNKRFGRVGDTPIPGAGCWADNRTCAVSATGHGEFFIREVVAYDIAARMEYLGVSLEKAAWQVVLGKLAAQGGEGGIIAVDAKGRVSLRFNTAGMFRGVMGADGKAEVKIFKD